MVDYKNMSQNSRVWIFQANRELTNTELIDLRAAINHFIEQWTSHKEKVHAACEIFYNRFIVFFVDESKVMTGGCSLDTLTRLIKEVEKFYTISLLDRMLVAYRSGEKILNVQLNEFEKLVVEHKVNENTIIFNNLASTKAEFEANWETPLKNSWHNRMLVVHNL